MRLSHFSLLAFAFLCLNFSCPEDDYVPINVLVIDMEPARVEVAVNDTIWFRANFDSELNFEQTISENGGLVVFYAFHLDSANNLLSEAVSSSSLIIEEGSAFSTSDELDEAGFYFRYRCPSENCSFLVGWQPQEAGMYLVKPYALGFEGGAIDEATGRADNYFVRTIVQNAPDYSLTHEWLINRNFIYQADGFERPYTLDGFDSSLFFEVQ